LESGWTVWRHACDNPACIAPHHSKAGTKAEWGAAMRASGRMRGDPRRSAAAQRTALKCPWTLPADKVRRIEEALAGGARQAEVARQFGCNPDTVSSINCRRHPHQRPGARGASVFHLT
jgi:hypothetical protein